MDNFGQLSKKKKTGIMNPDHPKLQAEGVTHFSQLSTAHNNKGMKVKTNATGRKMVGNDGKGSGGQNEDPRMKAAVEAKLATPSLNPYQALVAGGLSRVEVEG